MDYLKELANTRKNPNFAKLDYKAQTEVRDYLFRKAQTDDPTFKDKSPEALNDIYKYSVFAPPVLENKTFEGTLGTLMKSVDLTKNPQAVELYQKMSTDLKLSNGSIMGLVVKAAAQLGNAIAPADPKNINEVLKSVIGSGDESKIFQYVNMRDAMFEAGKLDETTQGLLNVTNLATDIIGVGGLTGAVSKGVAATIQAARKAPILFEAGAGVTKQATTVGELIRGSEAMQRTIATAGTQAAQNALKIYVPAIVEGALISGPVGVLSAAAVSAANKNPETSPFANIENFALNYGFGVAADIVGASVFKHILPGIFRGGKGTVKSAAALDQTPLTQEKIVKNIEDWAANRLSNKELTATQHQYIQDLETFNAILPTIGGKTADKLTDVDRLIMTASITTPDIYMVPTSSGGFRVWKKTDPNSISKETVGYQNASNILEATDIVAKEILRTPERFAGVISDASLRAKLDVHAPWLDKWVASIKQASDLTEAQVKSTNKLATSSERIPLSDRPYIAMNELHNFENTVVPVRVDLNESRLANLRAGKETITYNDLRPQAVTAQDSNAVLLTKNIKEINMKEYEINPIQALTKAREEGMDTLKIVDDTQEIIGYVPASPNNLKLLVPHVDLATGKVSGVNLKQSLNRRSDATLNATIHSTMLRTTNPSDLLGKPDLLLKWAASRFQGVIQGSDVTLFVKAITGKDNLPLTVTTNKTIRKPILTVREDKLFLQVPESLPTAQTTYNFIQDIAAQLRTIDEKFLHGAPTTIDAILSRQGITPTNSVLFKLLEQGSGNQKIMTETWLSNILEKELGINLSKLEDGTYSIGIGGKVVQGSLGTIYKEAAPYLIPKKAISDRLSILGITLRQKGDEYIVKLPNGSTKVYANLMDVMTAHGIDHNILPAKYRPTHIEYDPNTNVVSIINEAGAVRLNKQDTLELLNSFARTEPIERTTILSSKKGHSTLVETAQSIELIDPATKSRMFFATVEEAKQFAKQLANKETSFEALTTLAKTRGLTLSYQNGLYKIFTGEGNIAITAKNLDEVKRVFQKFPTENVDATELIPEADEILKQLPPDLVKEWKAFRPNFEIDKRANFDEAFQPGEYKTFIMQALDTARATIGKLTKAKLISPTVQREINNFLNSIKIFTGHAQKAQQIVDDIFKVNNKMLPKARREIITRYLAVEANDLNKLKVDFPLKPGEQQVVDNIRSLFGKLTETGQTGAAALFRIPINRHISNYSHRILAEVQSNPQLKQQMRHAKTAKEFIDIYANFKGNDNLIIQDMKNTFEYSRVADINNAIFETDAYNIVSSYLYNGLRKFHMDAPSQQFRAVIETADKAGQLPVSGNNRNTIKDFLVNLHNVGMGQPGQTRGQVIVEQTGRFIQQKMGKALFAITKNPYFKSEQFVKGGERILDNYMQLSYVTLLGLRPMTAFRNVASAYLTLGTTYTIPKVVEASNWIEAHKKELPALITSLKSGNLLSQAPSYIDEYSTSGLLKKFTNVALKMFKNGDEYTRLLGYVTATRHIAESIEALSKNRAITKQEFIRNSRLDLFQEYDPTFIDDIYDTIVKNPNAKFDPSTLRYDNPDVQARVFQYADRMNELNLFNYSAWNKPTLFQAGIFGKVAGQLGMFTASYRNYLGTVVANLSPEDRLRFIGNFIAVNLSFYAGFQLAGIRTNDFVPFLPGLPTASPTLELFTDILRAMDVGPGGDSPRRQLARDFSFVTKVQRVGQISAWEEDSFNLPKIIPGTMQLHYTRKIQEFLDKGDYWRAALSGLTASVESDWQDDLTITAFGQKAVIPQATPSFFARKLAEKVMETRQSNP